MAHEPTIATQPDDGGWRTDLAIAVGLFLAAVLLFLPSLPYEILGWDDDVYIRRNGWLLNLTWSNLAGVFTNPYFSNYHPLTMVSYMVDFQFWGFDPRGYRMMNLLLHGATVAVAFGAFRSLGVLRWWGAAWLLLFAVHPLRLESVVWLSERKDVLSGLFFMGALWAWVVASRREAAPLGRWVALAVVLYVLSLLSKAMAITFPLVVLMHDVLLAPWHLRRRVGVYAGTAALAVVFAWVNLQAQDKAINADVPLMERVGLALWAPWHYLHHTVWPLNISPMYPVDFRPTRSGLAVVWGGVVCAAALATVVASWRRAPLLAWGLLSCGLALGPVSGLVSFGSAWAADRYSYLPTLLLLAGVAGVMPAPWRREGAWAVAGAAVIYGAAALYLMPMWRNDAALWGRVKVVFPASTQADANLLHAGPDRDFAARADDAAEMARAMGGYPAAGNAAMAGLIAAGRHDEALAMAAVFPDPVLRTYWSMRAAHESGDKPAAAEHARAFLALRIPFVNIGWRATAAWYLHNAGFEQEALAVLEAIHVPTLAGAEAWGNIADRRTAPDARLDAAARSLAIHPSHFRAVRVMVETLDAAGRLPEAAPALRRASRHPIAPPTVRRFTDFTLGRIALAQGDAALGERLLERAAAPPIIDMSAEQASFLAYTMETHGRPGDASRFYAAALEIDPTHLDAMLNLAFLLIQSGRAQAAVELLEAAAKAHPDNHEARENLRMLREAMQAKVQ